MRKSDGGRDVAAEAVAAAGAFGGKIEAVAELSGRM